MFHAGGVLISSVDQPVSGGLGPLLPGETLYRPVSALLLSLMAHVLLLLLCVAGWQRHTVRPARPEVIMVFAVQQEEAGQQGVAAAAPKEALGAVKTQERPLVRKVHGATVMAVPQVPPRASETIESTGRAAARVVAVPQTGVVAGAVNEIHAAIPAADAKGSALGPSPPVDAGSPGDLAGEVLARPLYQVNPPPPYPRLARRLGLEGPVLLEVLVSSSGLVDDLRLVKSSGHGSLDAAASEAVRSWRFAAGLRNGQPVAMWVRVPVRFNLREGG